ncbi:MAG: hypothetical protein KDC98_09320, partial [Planctomycetes bacterium]|nr:hypothetical protein [Planctomycetota bacterium]
LTRHTEFQHNRGDGELPPFDVAILLDCSTLSRLGALGRMLGQGGKPIAVIDHHVGSENGDGTVSYVDSTAAATGALVRRLFREFDVPLDPIAAEGVFLSLVSDTGWFRYSNTDAEVFAQASELVAAGVDVGGLYDNLFRRRHHDSAAVLTAALQRHAFHCRGGLAVVALDKSIMERAVRIDFDTDSVLEPLRSIDGVEVVVLLKERFDGTVKLSMRARADVDVQRICAVFGGGGHKKAAGATLQMTLGEAEGAVVAEVSRALATYRQEQERLDQGRLGPQRLDAQPGDRA